MIVVYLICRLVTDIAYWDQTFFPPEAHLSAIFLKYWLVMSKVT